ncbi:MAG TPA: hypothetical protein VFT43_06365 [Candidatus Polarisedimenticolia bacterium]|nr:hypothetical protein [Candidatus Polarisedimenticolia bacterium]
MIDDELLQELLAKASKLYHTGEYKGAIDAWREALAVDPASQKAREGIRMATLLLGDWQPDAPGPSSEESQTAPADGAVPDGSDLNAEEMEARLDLGIAKVKQMLAQRKYPEAIEGARGLLPIDPDSEQVQKLLEEAQQAFESAPFIEEHLTLARELVAQERYAEAEAQCAKVFVLDSTHPEAKSLLEQVKSKMHNSLERAASQLGGMTVKLSLPEVLAAGAKSPVPAKGPPAAKGAQATKSAPAAKGAASEGEVLLDAGDDPNLALGEARLEPEGDLARGQEEVQARSRLDEAFAQAGVVADPVAFELAEEGIGGAPHPKSAPPADPGASPAPIEAKTVRPPTVRLVPRAKEDQSSAPPSAGPRPAAPAPAPAKPDIPPAPPAAPDSVQAAARSTRPTAKEAKATLVAPTSQEPDAEASSSGMLGSPGADETTAWETELTRLNLKAGERNILKGTGVPAAAAPATEGADVDLMSLLDTDLGGPPAGEPLGAVRQAGGIAPAGGSPAAQAASTGQAESGKRKKRAQERSASEAQGEEAVVAARLRTPERPRPTQTPGSPKGSSSRGSLMLLVVILLAGGAAAWWFYLRPGAALAAGPAKDPVAPPSGSSSGPAGDPGHSTLPTPIGGGSRQAGSNASPASGATTGAAPDPGKAPSGSATTGGSEATGAGRAAAEPLKPPTPPLSPEEIHRKVLSFAADGRRLIAQGKWREARAKLNAALALDPANFEVKELADQANSKIEDEQRLQDEFDNSRRLFEEKDYEKALFKLYRLPRDRGLGDIDLYIRNAWFNWAATLLKAGNPSDALKKLSEALDLQPEDPAALRLQEVAERYVSRAKDKTYWAYCDGLTLRAFDQK